MSANDNDPNALVVPLTRAIKDYVREVVREVMAEAAAARESPVLRASPWVDVKGAAEHFHVTPQTIRNWIHAGAPARQVGTSERPEFRIHLEQFDAWMQALHERRRKPK